MELQYIVITRKPLFSRTKHFFIGKEASFNIRTSDNPPLIAFLKESYLRDPDCLIGDVRALLLWQPPKSS